MLVPSPLAIRILVVFASRMILGVNSIGMSPIVKLVYPKLNTPILTELSGSGTTFNLFGFEGALGPLVYSLLQSQPSLSALPPTSALSSNVAISRTSPAKFLTNSAATVGFIRQSSLVDSDNVATLLLTLFEALVRCPASHRVVLVCEEDAGMTAVENLINGTWSTIRKLYGTGTYAELKSRMELSLHRIDISRGMLVPIVPHALVIGELSTAKFYANSLWRSQRIRHRDGDFTNVHCDVLQGAFGRLDEVASDLSATLKKCKSSEFIHGSNGTVRLLFGCVLNSALSLREKMNSADVSKTLTPLIEHRWAVTVREATLPVYEQLLTHTEQEALNQLNEVVSQCLSQGISMSERVMRELAGLVAEKHERAILRWQSDFIKVINLATRNLFDRPDSSQDHNDRKDPLGRHHPSFQGGGIVEVVRKLLGPGAVLLLPQRWKRSSSARRQLDSSLDLLDATTASLNKFRQKLSQTCDVLTRQLIVGGIINPYLTEETRWSRYIPPSSIKMNLLFNPLKAYNTVSGKSEEADDHWDIF